ncbi:MAG: multicopper oxidase domain-containing protein [Symploca sp. SIO3C6]|nr:multicopper oxidase domain-containing protein [Symploca sp. SIO3C6]
MQYLQFLRRVSIVSLVGIFISVSTFTGEAVAQNPPLVNSCFISRNDPTSIPDFRDPPFAYADTYYAPPDYDSEAPKLKYRTITLDAVQDKFYLDGDGSDNANDGYDGYLYKATYYKKDNRLLNPEERVTFVRDQSEPAQVKEKKVTDAETDGDEIVGTYTPPTIVVSPSPLSGDGDVKSNRPNSINLDLINDLPVRVPLAGNLPKTKENLENQSQYTNIHYHGFNVSPLLGADDVLVDVPSNVTPLDFGEYTPTTTDPIVPGGYYPDDNPMAPKYGGPISKYKMDVKIPFVHQSGLFWYHSHAHSLSDQQVRGGLSGGIIIKGSDQYYTILNPGEGIQTSDIEPHKEPEKFSVNQKVMMFKDFNDVLGDNGGDNCFTLNGQVQPKITIRPGEVQLWRIANVGSNQYMNIALETGELDGDQITSPQFAQPNGQPNFYILARDADFVEKVVPTNSVLLPPSSRVEVLVAHIPHPQLSHGLRVLKASAKSRQLLSKNT